MRLIFRIFQFVVRWRLWLAVKLLGRNRIPLAVRLRLRAQQKVFRYWVQQKFPGSDWRTQTLLDAVVQPFQDLLNKPGGGEAYSGGVVFLNVKGQPQLRHFRGQRAIDRPLAALASGRHVPIRLEARQFWCGPLAFHFGHQIADFGSRVLVASIDPRGGELLWCPWRASSVWDELKPWQQFLLTYLNPGCKYHRIITKPVITRELVVVPQQARMRANPTLAHLEALNWCEKSLNYHSSGVVYVSRARFAPCRDAASLLGAYSAEFLLEQMLKSKGVTIIHPETISLQAQLEFYLGAAALIVAEGSAQHGLELLGFHQFKQLVVICRRPQLDGMELPLMARFPQIQFVQALRSLWQAQDGVAWNGLALLNWETVVAMINPLLSSPLTPSDCRELEVESEKQFYHLSSSVHLQLVPPLRSNR